MPLTLLLLSLQTTALHNMSCVPLWALHSLSVGAQNNGAKQLLFEIDKERRRVFPPSNTLGLSEAFVLRGGGMAHTL